MTSDSSIDGYIRALKEGCRCVEVTPWYTNMIHLIANMIFSPSWQTNLATWYSHQHDTSTNILLSPTWWCRCFWRKMITWSFKTWPKLTRLSCSMHMFYVMNVHTEKDKQLSYVESIKIDWVRSNNNQAIRRAFCSNLLWKGSGKNLDQPFWLCLYFILQSLLLQTSWFWHLTSIFGTLWFVANAMNTF